MPEKDSYREPTLLEAILPFGALALLLGLGYGYLELRVEPLILCAAVVAAGIARRIGLDWRTMESAIVDKIAEAMPALFILIAVGFLVGAWIFSGTIPMLVYHGLQLVEPRFLLVTAFVTTALVSTATGTSWGAIGTAGLALIGIAEGLGASLPATAGAIVSGAYFGDKISPLSDTTNLAPLAAGSELYEHIRHLFYTTAPAAGLALMLYLVAGMTMTTPESDSAAIHQMTSSLAQMYNFHIVLLLPMVIVFYGALSHRPTVPTLLLAGALAVAIAVPMHGFELTTGMSAVVTGFDAQALVHGADLEPAAMAPILRLLNRGGMSSMMDAVLFVICIFSFAGLMSRMGCFQVILRAFARAVQGSRTGVLLASMATCVSLAMGTGDAYIVILVTGEMFRGLYLEQGLHPKNLSRALEDSGTVIMPLIPWSVSALYAAEVLGVAALDYLPWAAFCYLGIPISIFYALTGITIARLPTRTADAEPGR